MLEILNDDCQNIQRYVIITLPKWESENLVLLMGFSKSFSFQAFPSYFKSFCILVSRNYFFIAVKPIFLSYFNIIKYLFRTKIESEPHGWPENHETNPLVNPWHWTFQKPFFFIYIQMENNIPDTLSVPKPQFSRNYHLKYCFQK